MRPVLPLLLLATWLAACDPAPLQTTGPAADQRPPSTSAPASTGRDPDSGLPWVARADLPPEGQRVLTRIAGGGPFAYSRDGATFGNRERLLPRQSSAYYREYTVPTPGEQDRGARRVVCGGQPVTRTAECYYTADHYASFQRIAP
ncbi:ribonuclease [Deinococcus sp. HMF7604]|uniref:ribonuclease domain-containing protein n=1 Tax=Deinococcus betulae TaxID=2873312 RepID=UPI001CCE5877|nr:ribonuclease domain-containing protein [Deinococcus betulae]MBZ9751487.1 ribonuclease [Deinococcus betulae]